MKTAAKRSKVNWIPLPDPIREEEVVLELTWSADQRTRATIERQADGRGRGLNNKPNETDRT